MAQSLSFSSSGAINNAYKPAPTLGNPAINTGTKQPFYPTPTGAPIPQGNNSGFIPNQQSKIPPMPAPTTPVKSTTTPDGTTTTYHAPTPQVVPDYGSDVKDASGNVIGKAMYDPNTGKPLVNPNAPIPSNGTTSGTLNQQQTNNQVNNTSGVNANNSTTSPQYTPPNQGTTGINQGGLIGNLVNQSQASSQAYLDAQAEAKRVSDQQTALAQDYAQKTNNIAGTAGFLTQQNGEQGLLNNQYNTVQNALASQYSGATNRLGAANTQQGLQVQAGTAAGNLNAPQMQAGMLTNPVTGQPLNPGVVAGAVQQAQQLIQNGTDPNSPQIQSLLNPFGYYGASALNQALQASSGGTYNPTASSAASQQNSTQGAQYQGQATQLSTTLKQLDNVTPIIENLLKSSDLNSQQNPYINKAIGTYVGQLQNPAEAASLNAMMADAKTYAAQILGASGLNPTEVSATVNSFDPSQLSLPQLQTFFSNLRNLGENRLQPLQQTSQASYGGSTNAYAGSQASPTSNATLNPNNTGALSTSNPNVQSLVGGGMNFVGGIENAISGLFSHIF